MIDIRVREIPAQFLGMNYEDSREIRVEFQRWVGELWAEKDARIEVLKNESQA